MSMGHNNNFATLSNLPNVTVKQERHDEAEILEMAAKMKENHRQASVKAAAAQIVAANGRVASGITTTNNGQPNILNYLTRKGNAPPQLQQIGGINNQHDLTKAKNDVSPADSEKKPTDEESQKGHFGWFTFGKTHIPYILRSAEKYCAVRMVEMKLLNKYLNYLHPDIYSCTCVRSYYITEAEARLLNEINHKHCDSQFSREMFTLKDLVVRMSDAQKFYQFLDICYKKLMMGTNGPSDKCGFIRINKESVVPYTVREAEKFVPLFYFEGETENLRLKADYLSGWDLSYLKFCCKVQGIRNELFASDSVAVISLVDIKSYFPTGTEFEDYWPSKVVDHQLLVSTSRNANNAVHWTKQPQQPPPKQVIAAVAKSNPQVRKQSPYVAGIVQGRMQPNPTMTGAREMTAAAVQALTNGWPNLSQTQTSIQPNMLTPSQTEQVLRIAQAQAQAQAQQAAQQAHAQQRGYTNATRSQMQHTIIGRQPYNSYSPLAPINNQQTQQPPPLVRAQPQNHMANVANNIRQQQLQQQQQQQQQQHQQQQQQQQQQQHSLQAQQLQKQMQQQQQRHNMTINNDRNVVNHQMAQLQHLVQQQNQDGSARLTAIPEVPIGSGHIPYKVQRVLIDNIMVPCINMHSNLYTDFLITLPDLNEYFFPGVSLDICKRVFEVLGVKLYKGNRLQCQTLRENGNHHLDNIPLVQVRDVMQYMPQLSYMVRAHSEQPSAKRPRIS